MRKLPIILLAVLLGAVASQRNKSKKDNIDPPSNSSDKNGGSNPLRDGFISTIIERLLNVICTALGPVVTAILLWCRLNLLEVSLLALVVIGVGTMSLLVAIYLKK